MVFSLKESLEFSKLSLLKIIQSQQTVKIFIILERLNRRMENKRRWLDGFSVFELTVIALMAALGLATKPIIVPLVHLVTGPLFIPGGSLAGGFYMMWIVLGAGLVGKRGSATLIALVQGIIVMVTGAFGTHGVISLMTYAVPGFAIDFIFFVTQQKLDNSLKYFIAGIVANISGTYLSNLVFFRLPIIHLLLSISLASLSGGLGGVIAYNLNKSLKEMGFEL